MNHYQIGMSLDEWVRWLDANGLLGEMSVRYDGQTLVVEVVASRGQYAANSRKCTTAEVALQLGTGVPEILLDGASGDVLRKLTELN